MTTRMDRYLSELPELTSLAGIDFIMVWDHREFNAAQATKIARINLLPAGQGEANVQPDMLVSDPSSDAYIIHKDRFRPGPKTVGVDALDISDASDMETFAALLGIAWPVLDTDVVGIGLETDHYAVVTRDGSVVKLGFPPTVGLPRDAVLALMAEWAQAGDATPIPADKLTEAPQLTVEEIIALLEAQTGDDRLDASAIKGINTVPGITAEEARDVAGALLATLAEFTYDADKDELKFDIPPNSIAPGKAQASNEAEQLLWRQRLNAQVAGDYTDNPSFGQEIRDRKAQEIFINPTGDADAGALTKLRKGEDIYFVPSAPNWHFLIRAPVAEDGEIGDLAVTFFGNEIRFYIKLPAVGWRLELRIPLSGGPAPVTKDLTYGLGSASGTPTGVAQTAKIQDPPQTFELTFPRTTRGNTWTYFTLPLGSIVDEVYNIQIGRSRETTEWVAGRAGQTYWLNQEFAGTSAHIEITTQAG